MRGLLTDVNIQGFLPTAELLTAEQGYAEVLKALGVGFFKFPDFGLPRDCNDRSLWNCGSTSASVASSCPSPNTYSRACLP